ncbi:hypothetical protein [Streptomyces sp. NPDC091299]|uniref:hypothetical protein n=1 Tax=Streptomyces sp. NPDC091299 TaxID=3155302 RepID=UPI003434816A
MGGQELGQPVVARKSEQWELRKTAVRAADWVSSRRPDPLDESFGWLTGRPLAKNPAVKAELDELIDMLGVRTARRLPLSLDRIGHRIRSAACLFTVIQQAHIAQLEQRLKGGQ